jgi:hypothetical protein
VSNLFYVLCKYREVNLKSILEKYKVDALWHFTDEANIESISSNKGLLSFSELQRNNVVILAPGGNTWSHDADKRNSVHDYVHLAFVKEHPMLFIARKEQRIKTPVWLKIDVSVILDQNVRFTNAVANKAGVQLLTSNEAREQIDFEVLFTRMDWKNPEVKERRKKALKSEILIPKCIPFEKILDKING